MDDLTRLAVLAEQHASPYASPHHFVLSVAGLRSIIAAVAAQPEAGEAVPKGWKLVPVEPTPEMLQTGGHANSEWLNDNAPIGEARYARPMASVWNAMLASAPTIQPTQPVQEREAAQLEIHLRNLIGEYWSLAYAEGNEGREHDTEAGDAQRVHGAIDKAINDLRAALSTPAQAGDAGEPSDAEWLCVHEWQDECRENNWRETCVKCGTKQYGSGQ